jgi:hypothetical protein
MTMQIEVGTPLPKYYDSLLILSWHLVIELSVVNSCYHFQIFNIVNLLTNRIKRKQRSEDSLDVLERYFQVLS